MNKLFALTDYLWKHGNTVLTRNENCSTGLQNARASTL